MMAGKIKRNGKRKGSCRRRLVESGRESYGGMRIS